MSADLTCPTCEGAGESPLWDEKGPTATLWPCPCADGRRRPTLAEWDALVAERDRLQYRLMALATTVEKVRLARETGSR